MMVIERQVMQLLIDFFNVLNFLISCIKTYNLVLLIRPLIGGRLRTREILKF